MGKNVFSKLSKSFGTLNFLHVHDFTCACQAVVTVPHDHQLHPSLMSPLSFLSVVPWALPDPAAPLSSELSPYLPWSMFFASF